MWIIHIVIRIRCLELSVIDKPARSENRETRGIKWVIGGESEGTIGVVFGEIGGIQVENEWVER